MTETAESRIAGVVREMVAVEARTDVNRVKFGELCVWPIMRRIHHFSRIAKDSKQPTKLADIDGVGPSGLTIHAADQGPNRADETLRQRAALAGEGGCDALFVSRLLDHTDQINGLSYNRLIDPYIALLRGTHRHLKLEFSDEPLPVLDGRFEPTVPHQMPPWQSDEFLRSMPTEVEGFDGVEAAFAAVAASPPTFQQLTAYLPRLWSRRNYFLGLLQRIKPRVVFVICYYSADMLALVWACRTLGITTVDIQHGQQGPYHGMYNNWTASPPEGYAMVPDRFFCWGQPVKTYQEDRLPAHRTRPFSIVAGHPWIGLWRQAEAFSFSPALARYCAQLDPSRTILVGLQPTEALMPDALPGAMRRTPDRFWLLRLHPHQRHRIAQIDSFLKAAGVTNFEVEIATVAPLYALFRHVGHLLTQFSSVAWEAVAFDLPVTIIDPLGFDTYRSAIESGLMGYAATADAIAAAIAAPRRAVSGAEETRFIEPSLDVTRRALAAVLG